MKRRIDLAMISGALLFALAVVVVLLLITLTGCASDQHVASNPRNTGNLGIEAIERALVTVE